VNGLSFMRIPGVPLVQPGDDLAALISAALHGAGVKPLAGDLIAVAQKIVSKAEGRSVRLDTVTPSAEAKDIATRANKDPRVVELILRESRAVIRVSPGVIIVEHRTGVVLANAGIDRSNIEDSDETALLLPVDPDASAARLRAELQRTFGVALGLVITDSIGRAWRLGTVGIAIGCAGIKALNDLRGQSDMFGRTLQVSEVAVADSIAATAVLVMGEAAEGTPLVLVRGAGAGADTGQSARDALRPAKEDLFR
jgi:coenzyme F420-0:L-glutamate ligase/coenzyme F420-1:gamma-L-glutamate ligase